MKPTIYPHYTECPPATATREACRLLDLGLAPLVFVPPAGPGSCKEFLPEHPRVTSDNPLSSMLIDDWKNGLRPILVCERLPAGISDFGPHKHVFLVSIGYDFDAHKGFMAALSRIKAPLRLHLFLNPTGKTDPRLARMLPGGFETQPVQEELDIDLEHALHWSSIRFLEFHPIIERSLRKDDFVPLTAQDLVDAVSALNIPSPTQLDISTRRLNNIKKKGKQ